MCTQLSQQLRSNVAEMLFPDVAYTYVKVWSGNHCNIYLQRCSGNKEIFQKDVKAT